MELSGGKEAEACEASYGSLAQGTRRRSGEFHQP